MKKDFFQELTEYTKRPYDLVRERCVRSPVELAWLWDKYDNPIDFYKETDLYIFDLSNYQNTLQEIGFLDWYSKTLTENNIKSVLDFGGGIGETTIISAEKGIDTTYLDIIDSKTTEYAKWRFNRYNVNPKIIGHTEEFGNYDLIVAMDVLEHLKNPQEMIEKFSNKCKYLICPDRMDTYDVYYPQHISHYNLFTHFKQIGINFYVSNKLSTYNTTSPTNH
jgi:SAM-dependent methyltransferase